MKHILLLRHAKSSWDEDGLPDIDRPLAPRGEKDAPRIGKALRRQEPRPDCILSSTALRARQTVERLIEAADLSLKPKFLSNLYAASSNEILEIVRSLPDSCSCALLVGHNPGFEEVVERLTGQLEPMPTAALACIALDISRWKDVKDGKGRLSWKLTPKHLEDSDQ
jgi:phosphohistidine phosphatase